MINNKQVNIWRGDDFPPTIYHVWVYKDQSILLYNGTEWVTFVNDLETVNKILELEKKVNQINSDVDKLNKSTINDKLITDNPVLTGNDISSNVSGNLIKNNTVGESLSILDSTMTTLIIN